MDEVRLNIEVNHATLAGHSFEHEIVYATANGLLGSFDINRGDPQNGWDTDQFPNDAAEAALALYHVMNAGGFTTGGFNRSEEHTSEFQSLMRISYAVFCLKKKKINYIKSHTNTHKSSSHTTNKAIVINTRT